jgi:hypothetical protein
MSGLGAELSLDSTGPSLTVLPQATAGAQPPQPPTPRHPQPWRMVPSGHQTQAEVGTGICGSEEAEAVASALALSETNKIESPRGSLASSPRA